MTRCCRRLVRSQHTQADVVQGTGEGPPLGDVFQQCNIIISQVGTDLSEATDNFLNYDVIDKVFQSGPIWISEFKFVVICQQAQEKKCLERLALIMVLNILFSVSSGCSEGLHVGN